MPLRTRLTLYFTLIVVLPLAVGAVTVRAFIVGEVEAASAQTLAVAGQAVSQEVAFVRARTGDVADDLAAPDRQLGRALAEDDRATLQRAVDSVFRRPDRADVIVVVDPSGQILASRLREPSSPIPATPLAELGRLVAAGRIGPYLLGEVRPVRDTDGRGLGAVAAGHWLDDALADQLRGDLPVGLHIRVDGRPVAASAAPGAEGAGDTSQGFTATFDGWEVVVTAPGAPAASARRLVAAGIAIMLAAAALAAALLGWLLAKVVVRPVGELAEAARAVTGGDYDRRIEVAGRDEVATLGQAFEAMKNRLRRQVRDLEASRDALQTSLARMGKALSSTLDLNLTLTAVVDASVAALMARHAALYLFAPGRERLYVKVAHALPPAAVDRQVGRGEGLVGWVAQTGSGVRLPEDAAAAPALAWTGVAPTAAVAVPLFSPRDSEVIGVLVLADREDGQRFGEGDLHTLRSFAVQASVAIDNVRLHEAAQHASVTDGLTGLWNLRYFQHRAEEEVERAQRFGHDLSLAILDIDRFKSINDRHGHLVGDGVLVEVSRRVADQVREVDTLARYGGEELVLVLPETDLDGARRTAERIRRAVAEEPVVVDDLVLYVTVSLGVAGFPDHGDDATSLLRAADEAMYAAKQAGRNRIAVAGAGTAGAVLPA